MAAMSPGMGSSAALASVARRLTSAAVSGAPSRPGCCCTTAQARLHCRQVDQGRPRPPSCTSASHMARQELNPRAPIGDESIAALVGRPRLRTSGRCSRTVRMNVIHCAGFVSVPRAATRSAWTRRASSLRICVMRFMAVAPIMCKCATLTHYSYLLLACKYALNHHTYTRPCRVSMGGLSELARRQPVGSLRPEWLEKAPEATSARCPACRFEHRAETPPRGAGLERQGVKGRIAGAPERRGYAALGFRFGTGRPGATHPPWHRCQGKGSFSDRNPWPGCLPARAGVQGAAPPGCWGGVQKRRAEQWRQRRQRRSTAS